MIRLFLQLMIDDLQSIVHFRYTYSCAILVVHMTNHNHPASRQFSRPGTLMPARP